MAKSEKKVYVVSWITGDDDEGPRQNIVRVEMTPVDAKALATALRLMPWVFGNPSVDLEKKPIKYETFMQKHL